MNIILSNWKSKIWGETACLKTHPVFEVHAIKGLPGGYCSIHRHRNKFNHFYVISGELLVRIWWAHCLPSEPDHRRLTAGRMVEIPPGVNHQFEVITPDTQAIEIYWAHIDPEDIIRDELGGRTIKGT